MPYNVTTFRDAGLEAKWTKTSNGSPIIVARNPKGQPHQRNQWWYVDKRCWERMQKVGILEGFDCTTLLGKYFSI